MGCLPNDLFLQNCAQNAAIRVKPDTSWQPPAKDKAWVAHGRHLQHQFRAGLCQVDTDEITRESVWEKNYTVQILTKEIDMLPSDDIDAMPTRTDLLWEGSLDLGHSYRRNQRGKEGTSAP
jgi:hypothetical protein